MKKQFNEPAVLKATERIDKLLSFLLANSEADEEWKDVESSLKSSITYENQVFALPAALHYVGLFANYDLLEDYYLGEQDVRELFSYGNYTTDDLFDVIPQIKEEKSNGSSVVGINAVGDMINWLPSVMSESNNHFVWDEASQTFDYTSESMIAALTKINDLGKTAKRNTFNSYADPNAEEDPRIALFGSVEPSEVFLRGQFGFYQGMTSDNVSKIGFDYKFIGYPDDRIVTAGDFLCVSAATEHPEEAYEVARFLSFSAAGIETRYDIVKADSNIELTGIPANTNPEVTGQWFDYIQMEGVEEIYNSVVAGETTVIVEGLKTVPGYNKARYTADTGITIDGVRGGNALTIGDLIWDVCEGTIDVSDYISRMTTEKTTLLNKEVTEAMALIKKVANKTKQ